MNKIIDVYTDIDNDDNEYILQKKFEKLIIKKEYGESKNGDYKGPALCEAYFIKYILLQLLSLIKRKHIINIYTDNLYVFEYSYFFKKNKKTYFAGICENIRNIKMELEKKGHIINIRWVPGHQGVYGNEMSDKLAKETKYYINNFKHYELPSLRLD